VAPFFGLAIGDALGMPTQLMSHEEVAATSELSTDSANRPQTTWSQRGCRPDRSLTIRSRRCCWPTRCSLAPAGSTAKILPVGCSPGPSALGNADRWICWVLRAVRHSRHSSQAADWTRQDVWSDQRGGNADRSSGLIISTGDLDALVDLVADASRVTHHTAVAIAGAAAVAAAVSGGIDRASVAEATTLGIRAAELGQRRGQWVAGASVARRIAWATGLVDAADHDRSVRDVVELVGTSLATQESVPAAFAVLALHPNDAWQACLSAASLGGDSDTIAAMAGAIAGACHGMDAWPLDAVQTVRETNQLDLELFAEKLLTLRTGP
jgi:ADP-ribosylglycohydrolase